MKKLLIAAIAVFGIAFNSYAQEFSFGPKAGVNFATLSGDGDDISMKTGFHVGGAALFKFNEKMGVQAELLYSAQGAKSEYSETDFGYTENQEETLKLDYLNIPFSFKYFIVDGFNVAAGPQASILLSAKREYDYSYSGPGIDESESGEDDVKDFVTPIDFGFHIGAGYQMANGLTFDARYNIGFINVNDFSGSTFDQKNSVIQLSVGYMF